MAAPDPSFDYDLFVIGAGSGGVRAARVAALSGARVAVAEEDRVGGTCVIRGCVPKKFMVYASEFKRSFDLAQGYGWTIPEPPTFDWPRFLAAKDMEIARLSGIYVANLGKAGADLIMGKALFKDANTLTIHAKDGAREVRAKTILIATGGRPIKPADLQGVEHAITSNEAFHLQSLPKSIVIVGGGYIAVEFACIFHGLGSDVTLVYRGPNILRGFDDDVRAHLADELRLQGLRVVLSCTHESIERAEDGRLISRFAGGMTVDSEVVMFATGREPYVDGLNLEAAGVALNGRGAVAVDETSRTNVGNIYAVGDVTDRINLTPVAIREGQAFAESLFAGRPNTFDHDTVATAVFSQPPVGSVGMSEAAARHKHGKIDVYRSVFRPMRTLFAGGGERVLMKLVAEPESGRILGCHIVGPDAPEMIQLAAVAVKAGLTKAQWDATCALHPTVAEELVTMREKYVPPGMSAAQ